MAPHDWKTLALRRGPALAAAALLAALAWISFGRSAEIAWAVDGHRVLNGQRSVTPEARAELIAAALAADPRTAEAHALAAAAAVQSRPGDLDRAQEAAARALARSPARPDIWAQLAYIEIARTGGLSPAASVYLERSYLLLPYAGAEMAYWRLARVAEAWPDAAPAVREAALREARAMPADQVRTLAGQTPFPEARAALEGAL